MSVKICRKGNPCTLLVEMLIDISIMENSKKVLQKIKTRTTMLSRNSTLGYISKGNEISISGGWSQDGGLGGHRDRISSQLDQEYFRTLDDRQKQFYILNLSEKYNKVKSELMIG